jgi:hypothetical protein
VNISPLTAREVEALTFIYSAPRLETVGERNLWSKFFNWVRLTLRKRTRRPSPSSSAADWSSPGL